MNGPQISMLESLINVSNRLNSLYAAVPSVYDPFLFLREMRTGIDFANNC